MSFCIGLDKTAKVMGVLFHISLWLLCDFPVSTLRNLSILYHNIAASVETLVSPLVFNTLQYSSLYNCSITRPTAGTDLSR